MCHTRLLTVLMQLSPIPLMHITLCTTCGFLILVRSVISYFLHFSPSAHSFWQRIDTDDVSVPRLLSPASVIHLRKNYPLANSRCSVDSFDDAPCPYCNETLASTVRLIFCLSLYHFFQSFSNERGHAGADSGYNSAYSSTSSSRTRAKHVQRPPSVHSDMFVNPAFEIGAKSNGTFQNVFFRLVERVFTRIACRSSASIRLESC